MGYAVELVLQGDGRTLVEGLRDLLESTGVRTLTRSIGDVPHVSLGVFDDRVDVGALHAVVDEVAGLSPPLSCSFRRVNSFSRPQPVVYLEPESTDALRRLHGQFLATLGVLSSSLNPLYAAGAWTPHCTVAMGFSREALDHALAVTREAFSPVTSTVTTVHLVRVRPVEVLRSARLRSP